MTLDTTNSYVTLEEANAYFAARLYSDTWEGADSFEKEKVLLMSRRMLDLYIQWKVVFAEEDAPAAVKAAQLELALVLQGTDTTALPDGAGLSSMSVGSVSMAFDQATKIKVIPDHIVFMLSSLGSLRGEATAFSVTR